MTTGFVVGGWLIYENFLTLSKESYASLAFPSDRITNASVIRLKRAEFLSGVTFRVNFENASYISLVVEPRYTPRRL